jgi:hypothetical protein
VVPGEAGEAQREARCSERSYFCDARAWVLRRLHGALARHGLALTPLAHCRFLHYRRAGLALPPHTDLSRTAGCGRASTHTFILYLQDCAEGAGGETVLLAGLAPGEREVELAAVRPRRGRLLVFPHECAHAGSLVRCPPKLLLRGELLPCVGRGVGGAAWQGRAQGGREATSGE